MRDESEDLLPFAFALDGALAAAFDTGLTFLTV
jgi:hypothetical protein